MSVCRWSSDDYQCDVYVYVAADGWTTHVAGRRHIPAEPMPEPVYLPSNFTDEQFSAWYQRGREVDRIISAARLVDIGLPHDGETFVDETPDECADRLEGLRGLGYVVPQYAIDALREGD